VTDILQNPVFIQIIAIGGFLIPWVLLLIFKQVDPSKNVKRGVSYGLTAILFVVAVFVSGIYKEWGSSWTAWLFGLMANLIYVKMIFEIVVKTFIPEKWRHSLR